MIFDFSPIIEYVGITSQYSNAVLVALLPHVSDFAKDLNLPMPVPVTIGQVASFRPENHRGKVGGSFRLTNGAAFTFANGYVCSFEGPHAYYGLQDPDAIPKFYGVQKMTEAEAVGFARATIRKLGYSLESVFAEQPPKVEVPPPFGTNVVPHFRIQWLDPRAGMAQVEVEVNGEKKRIEAMRLANRNLYRPGPVIDVQPAPLRKGDPTWWTTQPLINPEYGYRLFPIVLESVDKYCRTLGLPLPSPLTSNHVSRFHAEDNGGWPHAQLELTNGWRFIYRNSMVNGFYSPDNLFNSDQKPILIKDYLGRWNLSEAETIEVVRRALAKLNYSTNLLRMDFNPKISKPALPGIPRYSFNWWCENETHNDLTSKVEAEVDADNGKLMSLYFDNKAFWNMPPPIEVPISPLPIREGANPAN